MSADRIRDQRDGAHRGSLVWPIATMTLLGLTVPGCGVNISPQPSGQTDSSAPPESSAPIAMTPAMTPTTPMTPMTTPDSSSSGAPYAGGAGYPGGPGGYNPNSSPQTEEAMRQQAGGAYGGGASGAAAAAGVDPAQMAAAAAQGQQPGGAGAAGVDPAQMAAAAAAAQGFGQNGGNAPSPDEFARRMRENAGGGGAEGNALGGAIPGPGGQYGGRGGEGGGGSFSEDDPEYVVIRFADAVQADDYDSAGKYVADKATGLLASVRKGDISDNQKQQLKAYVTGLKHIGTRPQGRSKTANFNGGSNKVLSFKIEKISDEFLISDLDIHDAPRQRARR